jgi:AbrB family looped-hinge helix DNA binding protein
MINQSNQANTDAVGLVRVIRNGQITLPADVRRALKVQEGDYFEAEVIAGAIHLKPVSVVNRAATEQKLEEILRRVKYTGPEPMPSADELAGDVADIIHDMRRENAEGGAR